MCRHPHLKPLKPCGTGLPNCGTVLKAHCCCCARGCGSRTPRPTEGFATLPLIRIVPGRQFCTKAGVQPGTCAAFALLGGHRSGRGPPQAPEKYCELIPGPGV
jgi:hypothetical protein